MALLAFWFAVALGVGASLLVARAAAPRGSRWGLVGAMVAAVVAFAAGAPRAAPPAPGPPTTVLARGYVGSGACQSCHPSEHASWSRTFHRTMTQRASAATVLAPLGATLDVEGERWSLVADADGAVWTQTDRGGRARVLLTTGSHHMQGYWVAAGSGALRMSPFVFAREEGKLIPRREAFVEPPSMEQPDVRWNSNCIACHATAGEPRADADGYATRVAELGIACEACHGPGAAHVSRFHDPFARLSRRASKVADDTIVDPARVAADRSAALCVQCHSYAYPRDEAAFWRSGFVEVFRPSDPFDGARELLSPAALDDPRGPKVDVAVGDLFWPDGTVRVAGREYNAMVLSACFLRGQGAGRLSCESCHAMHASDPDDMLRGDRSTDDVCRSCHAMPAEHSHHRAGSSGDSCVACHMPKTSYALRTAIRSHRIDAPDPLRPGRPVACNLCHLDRSVAWTARTLRAWRGAPDSADDVQEVPESARGLLARDAAERVLWADAMGDPDALAASGASWEGPLLAFAAANDPYAVVRYVAGRSLRRLGASRSTSNGGAVHLDASEIESLARGRDDHPMMVAE